LCDGKGRFLFEVRPDLLPEGRLTDVECQLWQMFYEDREKQRKARRNG
jgi:hypothetical protein